MSNHENTIGFVFVELPHLADAAQRLGVPVESASLDANPNTAIEALEAAGKRVIVVAADAAHIPGMAAWVQDTSTRRAVLIVRQGEHVRGIEAPKARDFTTPSNMSELFTTLRSPLPESTSTQWQINVDFTVTSPQLEAVEDPVTDVDPWAEVSQADTYGAPDPWDDVPASSVLGDPKPLSPDMDSPNHVPVNYVHTTPTQGESKQPHTPAATTQASQEQTFTPAAPVASAPAPEPTDFLPPPSLPVTQPVEEPDTGLFSTSVGQQGSGQVLVVTAAKGGSAKTTTTRTLAQRAGAAGLRVVLIDANRGQAGQSVALRLSRHNLPTMYDFALGSADIKDIVLTPDQMAQVRGPKLERLNFHLVQSPPAELDDITNVTPQHYQQVIAALQGHVDLIILDTQTIEVNTLHEVPMVHDLVLPQFASGAWMLGVTSTDSESLEYLSLLVDKFISERVFEDASMSKAMTATTLVPQGFADDILGKLASLWNGRVTYAGHSRYSEDLIGLANAGRVVWDNPDIRPLIDSVLYRVTGSNTFASLPETTSKKRRWWGK